MDGRHTSFWAVLQLILLFVTTSYVAAARTYIVNNNGEDPDWGPRDLICATSSGDCTLKAAVEEANSDLDISIIHFSQPMAISLTEGPITAKEDNTVIDGSSQWNAAQKRPGIIINSNPNIGCNVVIDAGSCTVKGIEFQSGSGGFTLDILGNNNIIGGSPTSERNVFLAEQGILILCSSNIVEYNYFGTRDGFTVPGPWGIHCHTGRCESDR
jgi:hypothetical protein